MRRRGVLALLFALGAAFAGGGAIAQTGAPLIVALFHGKQSVVQPRVDALREGLRELGYVEGRNYRLEARFSDNQFDRLPGLARELLALKPAVAVATPVIAGQALHRETKTVPIVMAGGAGAQRLGMIASLARPGGNVTGVTNQLDEVSAKQLALLKELAPRARRVLVLSSGHSAAEADVRAGARTAARTYGMTLIDALADTPDKLAQVAARCASERCEALLVLLDPNLINFRLEVIALAARLRIPAAYPNLEYADDGGLLAFSTDVNHLARRAARYVDKILKGARPADLAMERPTQFELVLNLKTATALGLAIPPALRVRADRVIE
jgi:putative ABC transport system substrate-binding protein